RAACPWLAPDRAEEVAIRQNGGSSEQTAPRPSDRPGSLAGLDARAVVARRLIAPGAAVLLFALGPLGAGLAMANGDVATTSAATEATLAKQRYVGRADRVCAASSAQINDVLGL